MQPYKEGETAIKPTTIEEKIVRRESAAGIHFAELYNSCQRRWMYKYVFNIEQEYVDKALVFGSAFHEGKAEFYMTKSLSNGLDRGIQEIDDRRDEFYDLDDYRFSRERLKPLLGGWVREVGERDLRDFTILSVEEEVRLPIPFTDNYVHTQRHDALAEHNKTGKVYTMETKTASSSIDLTMNTVKMSSQVTSYYWGGEAIFKEKYGGVIVDVSYWSSRSKNPATIKHERSEAVTKTDYEVKKMQVDLASLFNEVESKLQALKNGTPADFLFRKNPYYCFAYFRKCPLANICNVSANEAHKYLPDGLKIVEREKALDKITYDNLFFGEGPY